LIQEVAMLSLMRTKKPSAALALSVALTFAVGLVVGNDASAAVSSDSLDANEDHLRNQLNDIMNTPVDLCDPAAMRAHIMAIASVQFNLTKEQLKKPHPPVREMVQQGIDKAAQDNKAAGGDLVEDLPYVTDYENAGRRGDVKAQNDYFAKMTPAAQAQAAQHDLNFPLAIKLLTPLADAGDVNSQIRLASMYSFGTTWLSPKYQPPPTSKGLEFVKKAGMPWPLPVPPEDLLLAFNYYHLAAAQGSFFGQSGLARAYACGFGTQKNLILAYMWFSLALAQRGVTTEMNGAALPMNGYQKDYALDRDFITAQMKPEEIEQSKQHLARCFNSKYKDCR
jgi:hypothetical protein